MECKYVFTLNSFGRIMYASKAMCKFFGIDENGFGFHYISSYTKHPLSDFLNIVDKGTIRLKNSRRRSYSVELMKSPDDELTFMMETLV